ncbi:hypothetical protein Psta_2535 [Pirellula staleyi DSM 6068]|uniref:Uncharacterized protein n=1 Tax=Pirellula staleyi (strain ATCC 27377 / DSM 6068 / ICPB 4128) TaxID=530564 RepID=D2R5M2_PIRSD|nr:hypothetical protein [Pirellula staleyi]ADB17204.1 hypothetical protein Psta_2535 [Pirellula staleyi DSM 6068]
MEDRDENPLKIPKKPSPATITQLGCGHLVISIAVACALLLFNGLTVSSVYSGWASRLSDFWREPRIAQSILFLGPILLLVFQWWIYDLFLDRFWPARKRVQFSSRK